VSDEPPAPPADRLTDDEQFVLCWWSVQALAEELLISTDAATELLEAAYAKGRVQILGNDYFAGVQCDGKWFSSRAAPGSPRRRVSGRPSGR
jgi:hypothetical protein